MNLTNNTILITGGTSGIGLALAEVLLEKNNRVIVLGSNKVKLAKAKEKGLQTIACNLANVSDIENASILIQNKYPELNMLFNNAGVQFNYHWEEDVIPLDKISSEININITGQLILTQLLLPTLMSAEKAWIINTTSGLGIFPKKNGLVYSACKAAMRNFTLGLKYALQDTAIKVLEFIPPVTDTSMTSGRIEKKMSVQDLIKIVLPQLERERSLITVRSIRIFKWLAFLFPRLANRILSED